MKNIVIKEIIKTDDLKALARMINHAYAEKDATSRVRYRKPGDNGQRTSVEALEKLLVRRDNATLLNRAYLYAAIDLDRAPDDQFVGSFYLAVEKDHLDLEQYQGELCQFAIHQEYRGGKMSSGLGSKLRSHAEAEARNLGLTRIFLETQAQQSGLMNAYQQNGFFLTGKLRILHNNKFENGQTALVTLAKPLKAEVSAHSEASVLTM